MRFFIYDNDTMFTTGFDAVFQSQAIEVIHTPFHAPNANAFAERFVRSIRQECLDQLLLGQWHVRRVLTEYGTVYNSRRPQQVSEPIAILAPFVFHAFAMLAGLSSGIFARQPMLGITELAMLAVGMLIHLVLYRTRATS
jgi:hypothetical protein